MGLATSNDGIVWSVAARPILDLDVVRAEFKRLLRHRYREDFVRRIYDPRLTVIAGRVLMCFAIDTAHGICGGVAATVDFHFDPLAKPARRAKAGGDVRVLSGHSIGAQGRRLTTPD